MGCLHSRKECSDSHPNVFRVTNIDESGNELWGGQLELTETDLILCRPGRDDTVWPLPSLRRYGFDGDVFSFESGRRCPTGEGIYAFRCRRANVLFSQLQNNIQLRNVIHESMQFNLPSNIMAGSPSAIPRATLQASVVHRSSVDNGLPRNLLRNSNIPGHLSSHNAVAVVNQSPRSLSNASILEATPLYPRPQANSTQVTNVYQVKEFKSREHNNNQSEQSTEVAHVYTNDNDLNRSLAKLRNELRDSTARTNFKDMIEETAFLQTVSSNKSPTPTSPTASTASEHEQLRLYQNVRPTDLAKHEFLRSSFEVPPTPVTLKLPEYCNFNMNNRPELNYANLNVGEMEEAANTMKNNVFPVSAELTHKLSESDTNASLSPIEEVNYAILDMEGKEAGKVARDAVSPERCSVPCSRHESTTSQGSVQQPRGARHLSTGSLDNASAACINAAPGSVGYTTIDFDKTVALTSVVSGAGGDMESDGTRKTRHDSHCGTPVKAK